MPPGQQYGGSPMGAAAMYAGNPYLYGAGAYYGPAAMYAPPPQFGAAQMEGSSGRGMLLCGDRPACTRVFTCTPPCTGAPYMQQPGMDPSFNPMLPPYNAARLGGDERPPPYMMGLDYMELAAAHHGYFARGGYGGRRGGAGGGRGRGGRGGYGEDRRRVWVGRVFRRVNGAWFL